jgi:outer membrane receptor protein involved in Fe transport
VTRSISKYQVAPQFDLNVSWLVKLLRLAEPRSVSIRAAREQYADAPAGLRRACCAFLCLALLASANLARAQSTNTPATAASPPSSGSSTNSSSSTNVTLLQQTTVIGHLDQARSQILTDIGGSSYNMSATQINAASQGDNAPFNQLILRVPGVAQDSAVNGDLHVRGEHANLQYRINDVLLPEGIAGFGLELDPRFVQDFHFITGSLPAEYGFRTAGVVDITTKSGAFENGGEAEIYGGSHDTIRPSVEYAGSEGNLSYFIDGSYEHNALGIENPTPSAVAIHDNTDQGKTFAYLSYVLDDSSRLNLMLSGSDSDFQVPNVPGISTPAFSNAPGQPASFNSANLNENQDEQNYYAVVTLQKAQGPLNYQLSLIGRESSVHFLPDPVGDLFLNGVASDVKRTLYSGGSQLDGSYDLVDTHTLRFGAMLLDEYVSSDSSSTVYDLNTNGVPTDMRTIPDNHGLHGFFGGVYLQDEWKLFSKLTLNYGLRFDDFSASFDHETQFSPRVNLVFKPFDKTTLHAGYARYFTPPPIEDVSGADVAKFAGTSNASAVTKDSPVKAERANYFDAGVSQEIAPGLTVGVDSYYKEAHNQLDDGLFGQTLILSAFNYARGIVYGTEFIASYAHAGFSSYANVAYSVAKGEDWVSSQFLFSPSDLAYVQNHYIALDHDQTVSGSFGESYLWKESQHCNLLTYVDALYGSGLRQNGGGTENGLPNGPPIPNGATVPSYYSVNVGAEQTFKLNGKQSLKARIDIVNLTDNSYELRSGSGVGVNAAQYGARRGFFGSISYSF